MPAPMPALISAEELRSLLATGHADVVLLDCGFDLADTAAGRRAFDAGHLPGAQYAHLDRDLSGVKTGRNGRHPLPPRDAFAAQVGRWGIGPATRVVTYDAQGGVYAARAWWLLHWLGHAKAAVLDGGVAAWRAAGGSLGTSAAASRPLPPYPAQPPLAMPTVDAEALLASLGRASGSGLGPGRWRVLDARSPERYRGETEPLDPVAGRIPGAINRFHRENLQGDGRFKAPPVLRAEFARLGIDGHTAATVVHQCGSGVTACHNLLAMVHAGLAGAALYPGSWSEWCADATRPVERG
ncbi:MAG: sulfurtransferase [Rubrivivax sp.]|nr:sulfurtransferase [Rubrivivax sp.]